MAVSCSTTEGEATKDEAEAPHGTKSRRWYLYCTLLIPVCHGEKQKHTRTCVCNSGLSSGDSKASKGFVPVARAKQPDWYQRSVRPVKQYHSTAFNASSSESLETSTAKYSSLWHNKVKLILVETVNESHDRHHRILLPCTRSN